MSNKSRPSRHRTMLDIARVIRERGTCSRAKVGVLITNFEMTSILSMGYNGNFTGGPNECDQPNRQGGCGCIHAEENALIKAPYSPDSLTLFSTTSPCLICAKLILNAKIHKVVFETPYRSPSGIMLLSSNGVSLWHQDTCITIG